MVPPPVLTLRDGVADDAETVEAVHWAGLEAAYRDRVAGWPISPRDRESRVATWRAWLVDPDVVSIVGTVEGRIMGFCTVRASADDDVDGRAVAEMPTLYVHPEAWHRGYGRMLCRESLVRARQWGFVTLTLWVVDVNDRARAFYTEFGFAPDGAIRVVVESPKTVEVHRFRMELHEALDPIR